MARCRMLLTASLFVLAGCGPGYRVAFQSEFFDYVLVCPRATEHRYGAAPRSGVLRAVWQGCCSPSFLRRLFGHRHIVHLRDERLAARSRWLC